MFINMLIIQVGYLLEFLDVEVTSLTNNNNDNTC